MNAESAVTTPGDAAASGTPPIVYRIDENDRLVEVNEAWSAFARENGGGTLQAPRILGRSLWDFVPDATVCELYRLMVKAAREGRTLRFGYRCDSPEWRREFEMFIGPTKGGRGVEFRSQLRSAVGRPPIALLAGVPTSEEWFVRMCSWCHAVALPGASWQPLEDGVRDLKLLHGDRKARLTHGICGSCASRVLDEVLGR